MASCSFYSVPGNPSGFKAPHASSFIEEGKGWQSILILVLISLSFAVFLAPETPQEIASICEKHNSSNACQVW